MTNLHEVVIASHQHVQFSSDTRTATFVDGQYKVISDRGAYRFSAFTIQDYGEVVFDSGNMKLSLGALEMFYRSRLISKQLLLESNEIVLHPGSVMDLSGGGYEANQGPGAGTKVSHLIM